MLGTAQDVTEQRQAERLRDDILSAVSHELRTPLTSVRASRSPWRRRDELSRRVGSPHRRARWRGPPTRTIARRPPGRRAGAPRRRRREADANGRARPRRARSGGSRLDGRQVDISGAPVIADVDEPSSSGSSRTSSSTRPSTRPSGPPIHVRLDAQGADLLLGRRRGAGSPTTTSAVFETFNRGPKMLSTTPGLGIGLALVARFAEVHGGRTWVEDRDGGGLPSASSSRTACVVRARPAGSY